MDDAAAKSIVAALKSVAAEAVMKALIAKSPFFAGRFINPIVGWLLPIIIDVMYDKSALAVNFMWINIENHLELRTAIKTKNKLQIILNAGGNHAKAEKEFNEATDELIRHGFNRLPRG